MGYAILCAIPAVLVCISFCVAGPRQARKWKSEDDLWGPIDLAHWERTPCIVGRVATEKDVREGRAAFYLKGGRKPVVKPLDLNLPRCAIFKNEKTGEETPVIIIQAEEAGDEKVIGYRSLHGGNGMCLLREITLLDAPDERFTKKEGGARSRATPVAPVH